MGSHFPASWMSRLAESSWPGGPAAALGRRGLRLAVMAIVSTRNEFNDRFVQYFDERSRLPVASDYASENLTGIYLIEFSVEADESGGISDPEYLEHLDRFEAWYRAQPGVLNVNSFNEVMKRVNKSMHGDDPA